MEDTVNKHFEKWLLQSKGITEEQYLILKPKQQDKITDEYIEKYLAPKDEEN